MERMAILTVRGCLSNTTKRQALKQATYSISRRNISICATSQFASRTSPRSSPQSGFSQRSYASTSPSATSSPLGTIPAGASGTASHTLEALLAPSHLDVNEKEIFELLNAELQCSKLEVKDISGGCGSMYGIEVESEKFRGLGMLKQQRLVNAVLKEKMDREGWHGVQIRTKVPEK